MVEVSLDDPRLSENMKAIYELAKFGMSDEQIQKLYDRQVAKDKADTESEG